ncbi:hypothetical protein D9M73_155550 [compost metagenome]
MGQARRQVEHVARFQGPLVGLLEVGEDAQVRVFQQWAGCVAHLADFPVALAMALQQEHVVVVEVRADAATRGGEADHHIIDAPARQEAEVLEQFANFRHELVDGLYQQGPVFFRQFGEGVFAERAAAQFPRVRAVLQHDTRLDLVFQGQAGELVGVDRTDEIRDGLTDQQGLLLPVVAEKFFGAHAAQKLKRNVRSHG